MTIHDLSVLGSGIAKPTIQAYLQTDYHVGKPPMFTLKIGISHPALLSLHTLNAVDCSAYLSACNPFSRQLDEQLNAERHAGLAAEIKALGLQIIEGIGRHPDNNWPGEMSYLVLGLSLDAAATLGKRFQQNAFLWAAADGCPQLYLLA